MAQVDVSLGGDLDDGLPPPGVIQTSQSALVSGGLRAVIRCERASLLTGVRFTGFGSDPERISASSGWCRPRSIPARFRATPQLRIPNAAAPTPNSLQSQNSAEVRKSGDHFQSDNLRRHFEFESYMPRARSRVLQPTAYASGRPMTAKRL